MDNSERSSIVDYNKRLNTINNNDNQKESDNKDINNLSNKNDEQFNYKSLNYNLEIKNNILKEIRN